MKLRSKYSNLCDHDTSASQTDGRTIYSDSVASRGKYDSPVQTQLYIDQAYRARSRIELAGFL